jgi:hypothetical protein
VGGGVGGPGCQFPETPHTIPLPLIAILAGHLLIQLGGVIRAERSGTARGRHQRLGRQRMIRGEIVRDLLIELYGIVQFSRALQRDSLLVQFPARCSGRID